MNSALLNSPAFQCKEDAEAYVVGMRTSFRRRMWMMCVSLTLFLAGITSILNLYAISTEVGVRTALGLVFLLFLGGMIGARKFDQATERYNSLNREIERDIDGLAEQLGYNYDTVITIDAKRLKERAWEKLKSQQTALDQWEAEMGKAVLSQASAYFTNSVSDMIEDRRQQLQQAADEARSIFTKFNLLEK